MVYIYCLLFVRSLGGILEVSSSGEPGGGVGRMGSSLRGLTSCIRVARGEGVDLAGTPGGDAEMTAKLSNIRRS